MLKDKAFYWVMGFSLVIFVSRVVPHVDNFSPVLALCLLAGYLGRGKAWSILLPTFALLASDAVLGFYPGWAINYLALVALILVGQFMSTQFKSVVRFGVLASFLFFVISNFGVWMASEMYALTWDGLIQCYEMALPFARATFVSTMTCLLAFYGVNATWQKITEKAQKEIL